MVWTVNEPEQMMEVRYPPSYRPIPVSSLIDIPQCIRWGVDVIITDVPATYLKLRSSVECELYFLSLLPSIL